MTDPGLEAKLGSLRFQRRLRVALVVQDVADALMSANDVTGALVCVCVSGVWVSKGRT